MSLTTKEAEVLAENVKEAIRKEVKDQLALVRLDCPCSNLKFKRSSSDQNNTEYAWSTTEWYQCVDCGKVRRFRRGGNCCDGNSFEGGG